MGSSSEDTLKKFAEHLQTQESTVISLSNGVREYNRFFEIPGELSDLSGQQKRVLMEVLQAIGYCELDQLIFDDVPGAELLSSEEWDSFFSSLLSGQSSLAVHCTGTLYSTVCTHVGAFVAKSSTLELLEFDFPLDVRSRVRTTMIPLSNAAVRTLSEGLVQTKCLRKLYVYNKEGEMADVLTSAFTGDVRNTSVEYLHLPGNLERLGIALPVLLSSNNQNLKEIRLRLDWEEVTQGVVDEFRMVTESFRKRESSVVDASRKVFLHFTCSSSAKFSEDDGQRAFSCLDSWADASERALMFKTNLELIFTGSGRGEQGNVKRGDVKRWFSHAINRYIHLNGLQVMLWWRSDAVMDMDNFLLLCKGIQSNESVESLDIQYQGSKASVDCKCWTHLFRCLRHKRRLKELIFYDVHASDETFRSLMDLLQVNIYLEDVDLLMSEWESEGKCAMVKEALRRNRAQASYFSTLRDARLPFENARAGRIFLCGNPHAGKTRLRVSMMETRQKTSRVKMQLNKLFGLKRTKGVDVELLRDDEGMQVSIWDLAGQEIFRALQTLLLPTVTQACVFAFIFNPMKDAQHQQLEMKEDLEEAFGKELESWLRFIASNYPITGTFLPEVLVVITHRDRMKLHKMEKSCDWAARKVERFRGIYEKALKLHEEFFYVDAQDVKDAKPFVERVFQLFSDMLQKKSPQALSVCSKLISKILNRPREVISHPVWQMKEFLTFVSKSLEALDAGCFASEVENERRVLEALSLYMHDVGSIFVLPHCNLVVVDINWLTHKFLGTLISEGHGFEVKSGTRSYSSPDGFVSKLDLDNILMSVRCRNHGKNITIESQVLHDLLVSLDLCYQVESIKGDRFFIPTIFQRGEIQKENRFWQTRESLNWQHFGYRLLCESRDTSSLTSVVFPRFQIRFRKEMMERGEISAKSYDCQRDLIRLDWNGYFIIVENDGVAGDHVDFLVRFSKSKKRQEAMSFVKEQMLERFRMFCASPEGCRGVTMVTAIIRPKCVQKLTAREYREDQVILEKELIERLRKAVEEKLLQEEITWPNGEEGRESLINYEHIWPRAPEASFPKCCQRVVELLEEKDVSEILEPLREKEEAILQRLCKVSEQLDDFEDAGKEGLELSRWKTDDRWIHLNDEEGRPEKDMERRIHEHLEREIEGVHSHLQREFNGVHNQLQEIHRDFSQQLQTISDLQKKACSTLLSVMSKIDMLVGYSEAREAARLPRRPFITSNDVGLREKIRGVVQIGTAVRLHFMCESRLEQHIVEDQPGMELIVGDKNKELLRSILVNSTRVFWFLLKAGVQVTLGAGSVIPELADLSLGSKAGLVFADMTLDKLEKLDSLPVMEKSQMAEEVWMFLRDQLSPEKKTSSSFNLYLVKYNPGTVSVEESYAWLCKKCIVKGQKNKVLKLL
ncbi:hypothetical protein R1flu_029141 [Riccia fluitans]|uniref:C-terminal of Roc (COR) domain-containing protein n=1 Tax=Riccia fluitans TaxID=41844 RepID=A0ABD1XNP8_9MARC